MKPENQNNEHIVKLITLIMDNIIFLKGEYLNQHMHWIWFYCEHNILMNMNITSTKYNRRACKYQDYIIITIMIMYQKLNTQSADGSVAASVRLKAPLTTTKHSRRIPLWAAVEVSCPRTQQVMTRSEWDSTNGPSAYWMTDSYSEYDAAHGVNLTFRHEQWIFFVSSFLSVVSFAW